MSEAHSNNSKQVGDTATIQALEEIAENIREASQSLSLSERTETRFQIDPLSGPATKDSPSIK